VEELEAKRLAGRFKRRQEEYWEEALGNGLWACGQVLSAYVYRAVAGSCERDNEHVVSVTRREFSDHLNNYRLLKKEVSGVIRNIQCQDNLLGWRANELQQLRDFNYFIDRYNLLYFKT
jgi:hypothetical protein